MNKKQLHCCSEMDNILNEKKAYIGYSPKVREYFINLRNDQVAIYRISYCPWCGEKSPESLRNLWFNILRTKHNLSNPLRKEQENLVPDEFKSDEWWKKRGL